MLDAYAKIYVALRLWLGRGIPKNSLNVGRVAEIRRTKLLHYNMSERIYSPLLKSIKSVGLTLIRAIGNNVVVFIGL